jgi:hypothetical protein
MPKKQKFSEFFENRVKIEVYEVDPGIFGYSVSIAMTPGSSKPSLSKSSAVIAHGEEDSYDKARRIAAAIAETLGDEMYEAAAKAYDDDPDMSDKIRKRKGL